MVKRYDCWFKRTATNGTLVSISMDRRGHHPGEHSAIYRVQSWDEAVALFRQRALAWSRWEGKEVAPTPTNTQFEDHTGHHTLEDLVVAPAQGVLL